MSMVLRHIKNRGKIKKNTTKYDLYEINNCFSSTYGNFFRILLILLLLAVRFGTLK